MTFTCHTVCFIACFTDIILCLGWKVVVPYKDPEPKMASLLFCALGGCRWELGGNSLLPKIFLLTMDYLFVQLDHEFNRVHSPQVCYLLFTLIVASKSIVLHHEYFGAQEGCFRVARI